MFQNLTTKVSADGRLALLAAAAASLTLLAGSPTARAGDFPLVAPLVMGDDVYNGLAIVNSLSAADYLAVNNSGEWIIESVASGSVTLLIRGAGTTLPGTVILTEGDDVPDPAPVDALYISFDELRLNNNGHFSANYFYSPPLNTDLVVFNNNILVTEGDVSTATGFAAGTTWVNWWGTYIDDNDSILLIGNVDEPGVGDTSDPAVVVVDDPAGAATQTVLAKEGDELIAGRFLAGVSTSTHNNAYANGRALVVLDLDGTTTDDGILGLHDGTDWTVVIREGDACPLVPGRNWGAIGTATGVEINNNGDWAARTTLNSPLTDDTLIVRNGTEIIAREGDPVPALGGAFNFSGFANFAVHIDDFGKVYYFGTWNDTSANAGLFRNDELIVQEDVSRATTGELVTAISGGPANMVVSDNDTYLVFEGTLTNTDTMTSRQGSIFVDLTPDIPGDLDGSGVVDVFDLFMMLDAWGDCPKPCPPSCPADLTNSDGTGTDCIVDVFDLFVLLANWG